MSSIQRSARYAGLAYIILVVSGIFALLYVPGELLDLGEPQQTIDNIRSGEGLFRAKVVADLIRTLAFALLAFMLYEVFRDVNKRAARLLVLSVLLSIPLSLVNIIPELDILSLLDAEGLGAMFAEEQVQAAVMAKLHRVNNGILLAQAFWGLWLIPFGYLVLRCGFLPKFFGYLLLAGSLGYLMDSLGPMLSADYASNLLSNISGLAAAIGEIGIGLWLLIRGVREVDTSTA